MAEKAAWEQGIENKTTLIPIVVLKLQHESGEPTMKESGDHDEIVGEYNVNFGRENNPPSVWLCFLWWCDCVCVVVWLCFCGGMVVLLWWCVGVAVFFWWCGCAFVVV